MKDKLTVSVFIILILAFFANAIWLIEIVAIKKWAGLNWLSGRLYSPYIIAAIPACAFVTPFIVFKSISFKKVLGVIVFLYAANICGYMLGKNLCYTAYSRLYFRTDIDLLFIAVAFLMIHVLLAIFYRFIADKWLHKNKKGSMFILLFLFLLIIPFSLIVIKFIKGFGTGDNWIDAVKMGYPVFWATALFGFSGLVLYRNKFLSA